MAEPSAFDKLLPIRVLVADDGTEYLAPRLRVAGATVALSGSGSTQQVVVTPPAGVQLATTGTPAAAGVASRGVSTTAARSDHVHPAGEGDTSVITDNVSITGPGDIEIYPDAGAVLDLHTVTGGTAELRVRAPSGGSVVIHAHDTAPTPNVGDIRIKAAADIMIEARETTGGVSIRAGGGVNVPNNGDVLVRALNDTLIRAKGISLRADTSEGAPTAPADGELLLQGEAVEIVADTVEITGTMTLGAASLSIFPGTNSAVTSWAAEDANTSDDTPTQIGSTWTIADDSAYVVDAQVVAATDGAEIVRVHNVRRVVKATGSTITDGSQTDTSGPESLGGTLATAVSITRTGATGRVDITGVDGIDIRWRADVTITRLTMPPAPAFVMADIEWEGWIDGPGYSAGTFTGKASAGGSGSRNFDALGTPSTSTENGLATVLLDGTDDYIRYIGGSESADLIAPAGYTYFSVCRIDASSTNSADPYSNPSLGGTGDANAATGVDSAGNIEAYQYQGGNKIAATTWTTTVLVCVFTRYDGTNISVRKGKGAWTNTASSATAATASTWRWGTDYTTTARLTGEFCEHGVTKQVLSDAECDDIADAMAARWGVSV